MIEQLKIDLKKVASSEKAVVLQKFFKTGRGEYGENDVFIGVSVPECRRIALKYKNLSLQNIQELLDSEIHEFRLSGLLILIEQYENNAGKIVRFYLKNTHNINNWDLVDLSAPKILGRYLFEKNRDVLFKLAKSNNLWDRRISIISTFYFIKKYDFEDSLKISKILLDDNHDLLHKAVGWMLREIGKLDLRVEEEFLKCYSKKMPRTMLRYAIERFDDEKRKFYLSQGKNKLKILKD